MNTMHRPRIARNGIRKPHSVRFHDSEWNRIEAFAEALGLSPSEFVRHVAVAAVADGHGAPGARLAPLIETTFRATHILVSRLRDQMLAAGQQDELDAMVAAARALQAKLLDQASD